MGLPRNLSKNKLPKLLFLSHHLAFVLVEGRGRKKSLNKNREEEEEERREENEGSLVIKSDRGVDLHVFESQG